MPFINIINAFWSNLIEFLVSMETWVWLEADWLYGQTLEGGVWVLHISGSHLFSFSSAWHPLAAVPLVGLWQNGSGKMRKEKVRWQQIIFYKLSSGHKPKNLHACERKGQTYIILCDMRRQTTEHDGLALLLLCSISSVVLLWAVPIRVITIFWSITVTSFPISLLWKKKKINVWEKHGKCIFMKIFQQPYITWCQNTSGLSLDPLRSSKRSPRRSSLQRRILLSLSWSLIRLSRHSDSSRDWSDPYLPLRSVRLILLWKTSKGKTIHQHQHDQITVNLTSYSDHQVMVILMKDYAETQSLFQVEHSATCIS